MHKVFVFGTLKQGFPNFKFNQGIRHGSDYVSKESYPLYLVGSRYSPWLVLDKGKGQPVKGQVFLVSDQVLAEMDNLERVHEPDGYRKFSIQVECVTSGKELAAIVYGKPPEMAATADIRLELAGEYLLEHADLYRSREKLVSC